MTNASYQFRATSEADTQRLGQALAAAINQGVVIALDGILGAGKTRLVQAIATASGVDPREVVSPTFVLVHEYHGTRTIYHIDAYRLRDADEFMQMGADEMFDDRNLVLIEWADRVAACLPDERIEIRIDVVDDETRRFEITARGARYSGVVENLRKQLSQQAD